MKNGRQFTRRMLRTATAPLFLVCLVMGAANYGALTNLARSSAADSFTGRNPPIPDFVPVVKRFAPSFVHISSFHAGAADSTALPENRARLGSGFVIHRAGHILTNYHVIENAQKVVVQLADRRELEATVVGRDPRSDIAVLKVSAPVVLTPGAFGDSSLVQTGDWVLAMGSPFGFQASFTAGIVSAKTRHIAANAYYDYIQTDASMNPGNSGGPLLNLAGDVVGINTAIFSRNGRATGINFAIPINLVKELLPEILSRGQVTRGWLGISTQSISSGATGTPGLRAAGALVVGVAREGPAAQAGIQAGDVVVMYDGKAVVDADTLPRLVAQTTVGRNVTLYLSRHGIIYRVVVPVQKLKEPEPFIALARSSEFNLNDPISLDGELAHSHITRRKRSPAVAK
jgi:serine protease Do